MTGMHFSAGCFTGKNGQSAARWLKKLRFELSKTSGSKDIEPSEFLQTVEFLLAEDAEEWAETDREAHLLLALVSPLQKDVDRFTVLLEKRFPLKPRDLSRKGFIAELRELEQGPEESITIYYKRIQNMMTQVDVRDRPTSSDDDELGFLEETTLDIILEAFTRGFHDEYIRKKTIQGLGDPNRSVLNTYNLAERVRLSQIAIKAADGSKSKDKQLDFLWGVVKKYMPAERIEALYMASAHQPIPDRWKTHLARGTPAADPPIAESVLPSYRPTAQPRVPVYPSPPYQAPPYQPRTTGWPPSNVRKGPSRELPDASRSRNEFINGKRKYDSNRDGLLCVRCGEIGHIGPSCVGLVLPAWEQSYLKTLVFGNRAPRNGRI